MIVGPSPTTLSLARLNFCSMAHRASRFAGGPLPARAARGPNETGAWGVNKRAEGTTCPRAGMCRSGSRSGGTGAGRVPVSPDCPTTTVGTRRPQRHRKVARAHVHGRVWHTVWETVPEAMKPSAAPRLSPDHSVFGGRFDGRDGLTDIIRLLINKL